MRRDQDSINPRTRSDVMVLSDDDSHPFWYARVLAILHVNVFHAGTSRHVQRVDVLWARFYGYDSQRPGGFCNRRLHCIGFGEYHSSDSFGFIDPADVLRAVHLIPAYALGKTPHLLPTGSIARIQIKPGEEEDESDYCRYYVNMYVHTPDGFTCFSLMLVSFVDRDMLALFSGGGIGHKSIRPKLAPFREDLEKAFGPINVMMAGDVDDNVDDVTRLAVPNQDVLNDHDIQSDNDAEMENEGSVGGDEDEGSVEGDESEGESDENEWETDSESEGEAGESENDEQDVEIMGEEAEYGYDAL
jgi:hypothetical protein